MHQLHGLYFVAAPMVTLKDEVKLESNIMKVFWEYNQRKRDSYLPVTIRVKYMKSGDEKFTVHPHLSIPAVSVKQGQLTVQGEFSIEASYEVKLAIYEGDVPVPSLDSNLVIVNPVNEGNCKM